ncbi:MAG: murein biosynthesis integral membrane protein MurJ [Chloroflexota bacterium]|nr:murein biosynthesis integral membrane protein MurJ [Chloroflexota bacterium]
MTATPLSTRQIARAALVVLLGFLASGILGLFRSSVIASTFGATAILDAYIAAQRIPEMLFVLVAGGALGSSFIPVFARYLQADDQPGAWRLASAVMTIALLAATVLAVVIALFAPQLVASVIAPESTPELQQLTADLMRIMLLTVPIFSVSGLLMGILNAHQSFTLPALAAAMYNIGQIIGALLISRALPLLTIDGQASANVYGLAWGVVLGAVLHLVVQLPGLQRIPARLRLLPSFSTPGAREVLTLMLPRVLGLAVVQINFVVNVTLALPPRMVEGSVTAFSYAWTLMFFALGIVAQSVGTALFPSLSALAAAGDMDGYRERLVSAIKGVLFLALPAAVGLVVLGEPVIRALFERNAWTLEHSRATAWALAFLAVGVAGHALLELLSRAFYALADTWTPVSVGIASMVSNIILSLIFIRFIGDPNDLARGAFAGLALANSVTTLVEAAVLWWLLRRRINGLRDAEVLTSVGRAALAAVGMGAAVWGVLTLLNGVSAWLQALGGGAAGVVAFFGLALLLGADEARVLPGIVLRRLRRG